MAVPLQIRPFQPAISAAEARALWVEQTQTVMVALDAAGAVVGTYYLKPNSLRLGAHVANAGYVDAPVMFQGLVEEGFTSEIPASEGGWREVSGRPAGLETTGMSTY